ncbi:probable endolytic peptidoglycan transglycosylase RlpA [Aphidius gifuensis]|uniref:probable endolytic peptidoglycan transglycosylase RlpA n=1 Tax=Aphidius gifuensis TaxID=684658 RepID=UPI001CDC8383|nr:probable endolytic peptidoglycan transglycosylase RlpA [Aphidius gifuensis]
MIGKNKTFNLFIVLSSLGLNLILAQNVGDTESGICSWYGEPSEEGTTANGEHFDGTDMTAAHKTLPFNTVVSVGYNGQTVTVRINDRGPFTPGRILDVSKRAATDLGVIDKGIWDCTLTIESLP